VKKTEKYAYLQNEPYVKYLQNKCKRYQGILKKKNKKINDLKSEICKRKRQILENVEELKESIKDIMHTGDL
jgi:hypothetical protein